MYANRSAMGMTQKDTKPGRVPVWLVALIAATAIANPQTPQVVNGQASIVQSGGALTITNTPGTIINWQGFSIGAGETTRRAPH